MCSGLLLYRKLGTEYVLYRIDIHIWEKDCSATGFIDFNYMFMSIVILSWQLDNMTFTAKLVFFFFSYLAAIQFFFPFH